jgi:hypothetical protein
MKRLFLAAAIFFLISAGQLVIAQSSDLIKVSEQLRQPVLFGEILESNPPVVGQQYFLSDWAEGMVYFKNGDVAEKQWLKYDGLNDWLVWFNPVVNKQAILEKPLIKGFSLFDPQRLEILYFRTLEIRVPNHGDRQEVFAQVLAEGNYNLFVLRWIEKSGVRERRQDGKIVELPEIESRPVYVIQLPDKSTTQFRRLRRSVLHDLLPGKRKEIQSILAGHHLRLRQEDDLIRAIQIINESFQAEQTEKE